MKDRTASILRETDETRVKLELNLDHYTPEDVVIDTPVGFLNHMLELLCYHGRFTIKLEGDGDVEVDDHHLVEDIGICLGQAMREALGDRRGIHRYGFVLLPMDDALVYLALDISGRSHLNYDVATPSEKVGTFDVELVQEFFTSLTRNMGLTLHILQMSGEITHHILESIYKGFGRALRQAWTADPEYNDEIPSSKGFLEL